MSKINDLELIKKIALLHKEKHKEIRRNKDFTKMWIKPEDYLEGYQLKKYKKMLYTYQLFSHLNNGLIQDFWETYRASQKSDNKEDLENFVK
jgi:hypothetical protein